MQNKKRGFSLLELLVVVAVIAIISAAGVATYQSFFTSVDIQGTSKAIVSNLNLMEARAMAGQGGFNWGAHFVNGSPDDYYELFSTPTTYADAGTVIVQKDYIPLGMAFSDPASETTKDVIFNKITGTTTATTISVTTQGLVQTITVTSIGTVY